MQPTKKKSDNLKTKKKLEDESDITRKTLEEKPKRPSYDVTHTRSYLLKTTPADIYAQRKTTGQTTRAPRKVAGNVSRTNVSPMKDFLQSSSSSVSQISTRSNYDGASKKTLQKKVETKPLYSARSTKTAKDLPLSNVTVNSPVAKRRLNLNSEQDTKKSETNVSRKRSNNIFKEEEKANNSSKGDSKEINTVLRQRTKTRTLQEDEVKLLKPEVDNNVAMLNLTKKLSPKPTTFYIELSGDTSEKKIETKSSDEEVSYEDDFESYESDFESYHSEKSGSTEHEQQSDDQTSQRSDERELIKDGGQKSGNDTKEVRDEERMLDSGSFDLHERWSASRRAILQFITEGTEMEDHKPSLSDEGFQDMSSSNSLRHVDVLDRPLFIDFTKSKETKRKKKLNEKLKQRANDLLSMITLHEMSYTLFEMKPIPYDLYMATFGRSNYTQIACQTFEDGITVEIQTDEVLCENKWAQHPVEFSKADIHLDTDTNRQTIGKNEEDYLTKFSFLVQENNKVDVEHRINTDKDYIENPLRIFFEQKDGVGACKMLPYENYKNKLEKKDFNVQRLGKFLKRVESKVSNILNINKGGEMLIEEVKSTRLPFSRGYLTITSKNLSNPKLTFLESRKITNMLFSETKPNLIMTIHETCVATEKCVICLWDISVAMREPLRILTAIDNVAIARYAGGTDGIFVAALNDGSIHLWDLSEKGNCNSVAREETQTDWRENLSRGNKKEWILDSSINKVSLQSCGFTSSAANILTGDTTERVVGLDMTQHSHAIHQDGGRKVIGQICSLQRTGILEIWAILQEKTETPDRGKAFWSKMKLEPTQRISLSNFIDIPSKDSTENEIINFNLNAAKRRLSNRKLEKKSAKSRVKSASSSNFESDSSSSIANTKIAVLPDGNKLPQTWESGIVCYDLKVAEYNKVDNYLVAKNCGEVLCCTRNTGAVKISRFCVATDSSSVTCIATSPEFPYFLAATDTGTVHLCSMDDARVLLTLDCRNTVLSEGVRDHCQSDHKGRYVASYVIKTATYLGDNNNKLPISSLHWSSTNPCCIYTVANKAVVVWDLTHSDITARSASVNAATASACASHVLAILTAEGEVQVHKIASGSNNDHHVQLFRKYVSLL